MKNGNSRVPEAVKSVFRQLAEKRREIVSVSSQLLEKDEQTRRITSWQTRIRENMRVLDKTNELHRQYIQTLTEQEKLLEQLDKEVLQLRTTKRKLDDQLEQFVRDA